MIWLYIVLSVVLIYAIFIIGPAIVSTNMIFAPQQGLNVDTINYKDSYFAPYKEQMLQNAKFFDNLAKESISITSFDGIKLDGDLYTNQTSKKFVLFFHGYRIGPIATFSAQARALWEEGYSIVFIYNRSHFGHEGKYCTLGLSESKDVVSWTYYFQNEMQAESISIYGASMGGASVALSADKLDSNIVKCLVLDCSFSSPYDQISNDCKKRHIPSFLLMPVIRLYAKIKTGYDIKGDNVFAHLTGSYIPVLFIHGKSDTTVPYSQSLAGFDCTNEPKKMILVEGAEHLISFMRADNNTKQEIIDFINTYSC